MIVKNGKRLDGMGDSMPIGSIIEFDGTEVPDGWKRVETENGNVVPSCHTGAFTINNKTYSIGSWVSIDITKDLVTLTDGHGNFELKDNKLYVSSNASFTCVEISFHVKWNIEWTSATGNRGVYLYKNGERIMTDYNGCPHSAEAAWYSDNYSYVTTVKPGDYFNMHIVRGGQSGTITALMEHGYIKISSLD